MTFSFLDFLQKKESIGVVGLGYVGLPLATILARKFSVVGFDISPKRISELKEGLDRNREVGSEELKSLPTLQFTCNSQELKLCKIIIVAVPTPIDNYKKPDLSPLLSASRTIGEVMEKGSIIVFESTVYPGVTENDCRQELEKTSGFKHKVDFFLGYSPERVNPGDSVHTIDKVIKVVSGCNSDVAKLLAQVYGAVIPSGIHIAPSIATAEAAKVIENTQRDVNIALINELAQIFERIGIGIHDVLEAARTKWNFLDFKPGLVGGHCIGVDPYYLTYFSDGMGYHADIVSNARLVNDSVPKFLADKTIQLILKNKKDSQKIRIGILGVTFKENVPDCRNTKVVDLARALEAFGAEVHLFDPVCDREEFEEEYHRKLTEWKDFPVCDAQIIAVNHREFSEKFTAQDLKHRLNDTNVFVDLKGSFKKNDLQALGVNYWRP